MDYQKKERKKEYFKQINFEKAQLNEINQILIGKQFYKIKR